ncbi:GNAT family acetyltransferase [Tenacibaculum soleae]|uniref:GNAT family acetyltransferase n=1 Tax=Tenacibaculum soleae TaxID=447689 RepID=A0A1B9Y167_9FLAO|nr:GNAT family N-acetyltransferase [Tenacibaculum soleae]OCK43543.1 GNAT family acetyltransferase [Tenacibaculum soleae]
MIYISENIHLKEILNTDSEIFFRLMKEIYPPAYSHFWKDGGAWYVNTQYSKEKFNNELLDKKSENYFVIFNNEIIGNFRIIWEEKLGDFNTKKCVKLHRIYLHKKTQGNGIGKKLLSWLENQAIKKQYEIVWLDAMDAQPQAFEFYKKFEYQYYSHCFLCFELLYDEVRKMSQLYKKIT